MRYSIDDLRAATNAGVLPPAQLDALLGFLATRTSIAPASGPTFDLVHLLWYAGALVVISAMGLFSTLAFSQMGGAALTATALIYAGLFLAAGHHLWTVRQLRTPGGLLIAVAVAMTPLAVFGIQDAAGAWTEFGRPAAMHDFYTWIKGSFVFMELATIAAALAALRVYRFPFIVFIMAVALWFLSMDVVPWITGSTFGNWEISRKVSIWFGLGMLVSAVVIQMRQRNGDFAFWLYLFGVLTFWGAISFTSGGSALDKALYCALNVGFLIVAAVLSRRVFAVFGTIGIAMYLGDLAQKIFADSMLFPFALSLIGIAIIALGLYYNRHRSAIEAWVDARLPPNLRQLRG